jgi:hypothetical protein
MTPIDHINQQAVASYIREAIWPGNKTLPNSWSKWRDDKRSLCQMILKKVALPLGVDGKSYWEAIILGITNNKFCSLSDLPSLIGNRNLFPLAPKGFPAKKCLP